MRIIAKNLVKIYGDRSVVNDVSFDINKGEVVGLLGPNGAGKTTTFYMVVGLVKANKGQVLLEDDNKNITDINIETLIEAGFISKNNRVKILGKGELTKALNVTAHAFSQSAIAAIEAKGGKVEKL